MGQYKAPYHKSWPDLKSSSKTLLIRRKVLNVYALFILTILMVDSMDLLHSIWRVPTLCLNQCLHSMWHIIDQVIQYILSNRPPNFVYPFANYLMNVLRGSIECCCIWISPMEFKFEVCPEILDQIHIRWVWRSIIHYRKSMFCHCRFEERLSLFTDVWSRIVLLKCNTSYVVSCKSVEIWKKILVEKGYIFIASNGAVNRNNWTQFIADKTFPNHLKYIAVSCFASNILKCILFFLSLMSKNPNLLMCGILLNYWLVRLSKFSPIFSHVIFIFHCSLETFFGTVFV